MHDGRGVGDRTGIPVGNCDGRIDGDAEGDDFGTSATGNATIPLIPDGWEVALGNAVGLRDGGGVGIGLGTVVNFSAGVLWTFSVGSEEGTSWRYVLE